MSSDDENFYRENNDEVSELLGLTKRRPTYTGGQFPIRRQREEEEEKKQPKGGSLEYEREKKRKYKDGMRSNMQRIISNYLGGLDRDRGDIIGPIEIKSVTTYVIVILIVLLVYYGLLFILSIIQLLIPLFSINGIKVAIFVLFLVSQVVFYILFYLLLYINIINYITLIIYLGLVSGIVFVTANALNPFSIIFTNAVVGIAYGVFILIIWLVRTQLEQIKRYSPNLDISSFMWISICLFAIPEFIAANQAFLIFFYLPFWFNLLFQFVDELVEIFRGVTGPYKGLYSIEGILVHCNLLYAQFVMTFFFLYVVKFHGIIIFVFWPPWFYNLPASWFTWL